MDAASLLFFIYQAGTGIIEQCECARRCRNEAGRIAHRVQGIMTTLNEASKTFAGCDDNLQICLLGFHKTFIAINVLVEQCSSVARVFGNASRIAKSLEDEERNLERLCADLQLAMPRVTVLRVEEIVQQEHHMLTQQFTEEIRKIHALISDGTITIREQIEAVHIGHPRSRASAAGSSSATGQTCQFIAARPLQVGDLDMGIVLGEGSFGKVEAATYRGMQVAVKTLKISSLHSSDLANFRQEAERHASLKHPNIVEVFAFGLVNPLCMVMERMDKTLYDHIADKCGIETAHKRTLLVGICEGLRYLHSLKLIHLDLKSPNILLNGADYEPKLSDFGLSRVASTVRMSNPGSRTHGAAVGSEQWMAPEIFADGHETPKADIFSLHVVFYEVLSESTPNSRIGVGAALARNFERRLVVQEEDTPGINLQPLMDSCAKVDPNERPDMDTVLRMFKTAWPDKRTTHYPDGRTYVGEMRDGKRHGKGRLEYPSGDYYDGEFNNDICEGQGSRKSSAGIHEGTYRDNKPNGQGAYALSDGSTYNGEFRNGDFDGQGTWKGVDGTEYEGGFVNNVFEGQGTWTKHGERYVGEFKNDKRDGQGKLTRADGFEIEGPFRNGLFEGQTYTHVQRSQSMAAQVAPMDGIAMPRATAEGARMQASSAMDTSGRGFSLPPRPNAGFTGQGRSDYPDGSKYVGFYKDGKRHGQGKLTCRSGSVYEGIFEDGSFQG